MMLCKLKREPPRTIRRERRSACMRKKAYLLLIIGPIVILALLVAFLLSPLWLTNIDEYFRIKSELNNPYINGGLADWQTVSIPADGFTFRLPLQWDITEANGEYTIVDEDGTAIADLARTDREPYRLPSGDTVTADTRQWLDDPFILNKASLFRLTVQGSDGEEHTLYELRLHNWDDAVSSLRFTFWDALPEEQIVAYMEAIAYSYVYN